MRLPRRQRQSGDEEEVEPDTQGERAGEDRERMPLPTRECKEVGHHAGEGVDDAAEEKNRQDSRPLAEFVPKQREQWLGKHVQSHRADQREHEANSSDNTRYAVKFIACAPLVSSGDQRTRHGREADQRERH